MSKISKNLNTVQLEAVKDYSGPSLIIAGAGSGKTRVLTYRIAYLLEKGIDPNSILALTFTNKAAREMKERIFSFISDSDANKIWIGTFHSMFSRILRTEAKSLGYTSSFTIYDSIDSKNLIKSIIRELKLDDNIYKPGNIAQRISLAKNNLISAQAYNNNSELISSDQSTNKERTGEIYKIYSSRCFRAGAMDFDDLLLNTNILFRDFPEILAKYQDKFRYILVDEYQDTNFSQYLIIKKLSGKYKNICVVGDDAQSIYSFRGAKIENILNFKNDYPEYKLFKLEQNYRSTQNIVNAANSLIKKNKNRISKNVWSDNENGEKVKIIKTLTDHEEGFIVSNSIFENHQNKQLSYKNFAILYRTNAQSRIFEESLRKQNIPYRVYGSISFYQRKEIKDMISYFRLCVNPNDEEALLRIINYPARGIGKTTIDKIRKCAQENNKNLWGIITGLDKLDAGLNKGTVDKLKGFSLLLNDFSSKIETKDASSLALYIAEKTNILKDLLSDSSPENFSKSENISELLNGIREFTDNHETEDKFIGLDRYIENVSLLTSMDEKNNNEIDKVSIMTIHSAKGLEFDHVYIVGLEEDLFPSQLSSSSQKELEEERRLFYVAITRAKKLAVITYTQSRYKWGKPINCIPSRFIREIDESFIDNTDNNNNIFREPVKKSFFQNKKFSNKDSKTSIKTRSNITDYQEKEIIKRKLKTVNSVLNKPGKTISLSEKDQNFSFSDPEKIKTGTEVEHQRFGIGKVIKMEGNSPNIKATVLFKTGGQKLLLLKFAKLKIINA